MRFLLLNQTFHPDVAATSQYLTQFALALAARAHEVAVIASRRGYDQPEIVFPAREHWNKIQIHRVRSSGLGKTAKWRRATDFATFLLSCIWELTRVPKPEVVMSLTSPPLISFIGALYARLRGARFVYWVMDLNPDEAVAAGWLKPSSLTARLLDALSRYSFQHADRIIALDRFMAERIAAKGIPRAKIEIIPPWSHEDVIRFDEPGRDRFRKQQGLEGKFVVMYSGNHSPCHPLNTLLEAARRLANDCQVIFVFVGGGSELPRVKCFARQHRLEDILCLPYQPATELAGSLSAADLHVVVMGDPFVGTIHPCKIYNILSVGAPILYIGPEESHICDIFGAMDSPEGEPSFYRAKHGDVDQVIQQVGSAVNRPRPSATTYRAAQAAFLKSTLLPRLVALVESLRQGT